jgi:hypothetical protein
MSCITCKRDTVQTLNAKSDDQNVIYGKTGEAILLSDYLDAVNAPNIGTEVGVEMEWCTNCGQIQGNWPLNTTNGGLCDSFYEVMSTLPAEFPDGRFYVDSDMLEQLITLSDKDGVWVSVLNIGGMFVDANMVKYNLTGTVKMPSELGAVMATMTQEDWLAYVAEKNITNADMYSEERMHKCISGIKVLCSDGMVSIENPGHSG